MKNFKQLLISVFPLVGVVLLGACNSSDSSNLTTSESLSSAQVASAGEVTSGLSSSALTSSNFSLVASDGQARLMSSLRGSEIMANMREMKFYSSNEDEIRWSLVTTDSYWEAPSFEMEQDVSADEPREFNSLDECTESESGSTFTLTCNSNGVVTTACGDTTYSYTDLELILALTLTESVFAIGFDMSASVSGGEFDSDTLACDFTMQVDLSDDQASFEDLVSIESCSCSLNGEAIGCTDLEESWEGSSCNSFETQ